MVETIRSLVRPFIAFCFIGSITILTLMGKIDPNEILQTGGIIVGFYFGERAALKGLNGSQ